MLRALIETLTGGTARTDAFSQARYRLGVSSNLFSGVLPEGIYYPDFTTLEDHRPLEFISIAGTALGKPWTQCTILDLGCGEGTSSVAIGKTGARVIGIEGRPEVVARAAYLRDRSGYTNVEFRTGSVLDPALWEKADAVFASGLIHHLDQPFRLMELIGEHCTDLAYFCTHLAPRDESQRAASFFSGLLHETGSMEFRGKSLPGIRFAEGNDTREQAGPRRRHPRAGIGNAYSWWPTEESFVGAMKEVGFPVVARLAFNDHRLRYRLCLRRAGDIPDRGREPVWWWEGPRRPSPETAWKRTLAADIVFLKQNRISPAVTGSREVAARICASLRSEGIQPSVVYVAGTPSTSGMEGLKTRPLESLAADGPEYVVVAADCVEDLRKRIGELVTLRACRYAFTSFTLAEIASFPALSDPITGEPAVGQPASPMIY